MQLADAIIYENEPAVIATINAGADVNEHDRFGMRPLIQAVICRKPAALQALLSAGADIEQGDFINRTALQWAADRGEVEICYFLLSNGANPNHFSADGQPILVNPILREQLELVELFLQFNVDYQFAQDFISAKLLGHRFELTGEADIVSPDRKFIPLSVPGAVPSSDKWCRGFSRLNEISRRFVILVMRPCFLAYQLIYIIIQVT